MSEKSPNRRHIWIPDTQLGPGVPTKHIAWAAEAVVDYLPDEIIVAGDWWDNPTLSSYEKAGSKFMEGRRIFDDFDVGNEAFKVFVAPMEKEIKRRIDGHLKRWTPGRTFLFGNHEDRVSRALKQEPKYEGLFSLNSMLTPGFERHDFLKMVEIDGITYSHYFANVLSGRPIGGSIDNRLNKIGTSFVAGHEQGFSYGVRQYPGKLTRHGLVAGSFYLHDEHYRGAQGTGEWRGIVVLNEVRDGQYDIMPLSMDYLRKKYG